MTDAPPSQSLFETGSATHVGLVRSANEDSFIVRPDIGVWAVADGMGGHEGGAYASGLVVERIAKMQGAADLQGLVDQCLSTIGEANGEILGYARDNGKGTVGTTVAALLAMGRRFACVWCGDSRVYRLREGTLDLVTRDHTQLQEFIDSGALTEEEATNWPNRNVLTRAVGVVEDPMAETCVGEMRPDDVFIICSDGLTGHVSADEICNSAERRTASSGCAELVELALSRGGKDNVTVIIVRFRPEITRNMPPPRPATAV